MSLSFFVIVNKIIRRKIHEQKAEELEEDGISKIEEKRVSERISIKEKLAEKKAIIDQKSKGDKSMQERDIEKKKQREM